MDAGAPKAAVAVAYVAMIAANGLTFTGMFGESIGDISADNPTWVTPDGKTFAIWGVIYTLFLLLVVRQCNSTPEDEQLLSQPCPLTGLAVRWRIVLAFLLNAAWLPAWSALQLNLALVIIVSYLGVLLSIYTALNSRTCTASLTQWLCLAAPIASNASWLVVATSANVFTVGRHLGWQDEFGVGGSARAGAVVAAAVAALAAWRALGGGDVAWGLVASWALAGLYRMQSVPNAAAFPVQALSPVLSHFAGACAAIALGASVVGCWVLWEQQQKHGHSLLPQP